MCECFNEYQLGTGFDCAFALRIGNPVIGKSKIIENSVFPSSVLDMHHCSLIIKCDADILMFCLFSGAKLMLPSFSGSYFSSNEELSFQL